MGISEKEAARQIRVKDRERTDFVQDHFLKDPRDPHNYDLVLNVSRLSASKNAEVIVEGFIDCRLVRPRRNLRDARDRVGSELSALHEGVSS